MAEQLRWPGDALDWPHQQASQFIQAGGLRWHVQLMGEEKMPGMLLLHGTGASLHSWAGLAPLLAQHYRVISVDLPGHGFTQFPSDSQQFSLPGMVAAIGALLAELDISITQIVGHSAGAALGVWMCLERHVQPQRLVGINAALLPLPGAAQMIFSPAAKLLWNMRFVPHVFAQMARSTFLTPLLLQTTGSSIDKKSQAIYAQLLRSPAHVNAALAMMAHWDLPALEQRLATLETSLTLLVGQADRTVPPSDAQRIARRLPHTEVVAFPGLGHLAHEEKPTEIAQAIFTTFEI
jgi:magnesium chelatase accessory protein